MAGGVVADVGVRVGADVLPLVRGLDKGSKHVDSFGTRSVRQLSKTTAHMVKLGAAATAAGAAMAAALYAKGASLIDQQAKLARSMDSSVLAIQSLDRAAELAGISQDGLANAAGKLNARLGEAMRGTGQAASQLERLNLSASDLAAMEADERLAAIADRMKALGYNSAQAGDALKQFGIREEQIVGLMLEGGDAFRSARQEVQDFGIAVSDVDAAKVEAANDAWTSIKLTLQGVANQVAIQLAPYVTLVGNRFGDAAKEAGGFGSEVETVLDRVVTAVGFVANSLHGMRIIIKSLEAAFYGFAVVVNKIFQGINAAFGTIIDGISGNINSLIAQLNNIPGVDLDLINISHFTRVSAEFEQSADRMIDKMKETASEANELALQELPLNAMREFIVEARAVSQAAAEASAAARDASKDMSGGDSEPSPELLEHYAQLKIAANDAAAAANDALAAVYSTAAPSPDALENYAQLKIAADAAALAAENVRTQINWDASSTTEQDAAAKRLEVLRESMKSERDLLEEQNAATDALLSYGLETSLINLKQHGELVLATQQKHAEALAALETDRLNQEKSRLAEHLAAGYLTQEEYNLKMLSAQQAHDEALALISQRNYEFDAEFLKARLDNKLITQEEYNLLMEAEAQRHVDAMLAIARGGDIKDKTDQDKADAEKVAGKQQMWNDLTSLMNSKSKKMFQIGKAAAIAQMAIEGWSSASSAWAAGMKTGGPWLAAAYTAASLAKTGVMISNARSQQFGGGSGSGSTTSFSGGVPVQNVQQAGSSSQQQPQQRNVSISVSGGFISTDALRSLIGQIGEQLGDGVNLRLANA